MTEATATLYINAYDSRCGNCGRKTLPDAQHHAYVAGYAAVGTPGCGARFMDLWTDYEGQVTPEEMALVRPDLPVRQAV